MNTTEELAAKVLDKAERLGGEIGRTLTPTEILWMTVGVMYEATKKKNVYED